MFEGLSFPDRSERRSIFLEILTGVFALLNNGSSTSSSCPFCPQSLFFSRRSLLFSSLLFSSLRFASKDDDDKHRSRCREFDDVKEAKGLKLLIEQYLEVQLKFFDALSPEFDLKYSSEEDFP